MLVMSAKFMAAEKKWVDMSVSIAARVKGKSRAMCYDVWFGEEDRRQSWS